MQNPIWKTPVLPKDSSIKGGTKEMMSVKQSVYQNLWLMAYTKPGTYWFDPYFGAQVWAYDFNRIATSQDIRKKIQQDLLRNISRYEPRLSNTKVQFKPPFNRSEQSFILWIKAQLNRKDFEVEIKIKMLF